MSHVVYADIIQVLEAFFGHVNRAFRKLRFADVNLHSLVSLSHTIFWKICWTFKSFLLILSRNSFRTTLSHRSVLHVWNLCVVRGGINSGSLISMRASHASGSVGMNSCKKITWIWLCKRVATRLCSGSNMAAVLQRSKKRGGKFFCTDCLGKPEYYCACKQSQCVYMRKYVCLRMKLGAQVLNQVGFKCIHWNRVIYLFFFNNFLGVLLLTYFF